MDSRDHKGLFKRCPEVPLYGFPIAHLCSVHTAHLCLHVGRALAVGPECALCGSTGDEGENFGAQEAPGLGHD